MHLGLIKLTQIQLRGATQVLGVGCIFEIASSVVSHKNVIKIVLVILLS
jgi:hypothetical protein